MGKEAKSGIAHIIKTSILAFIIVVCIITTAAVLVVQTLDCVLSNPKASSLIIPSDEDRIDTDDEDPIKLVDEDIDDTWNNILIYAFIPVSAMAVLLLILAVHYRRKGIKVYFRISAPRKKRGREKGLKPDILWMCGSILAVILSFVLAIFENVINGLSGGFAGAASTLFCAYIVCYATYLFAEVQHKSTKHRHRHRHRSKEQEEQQAPSEEAKA